MLAMVGGVAGCQGGGGSLDAGVDADVADDSVIIDYICHPVAQTGCESGEKCSTRWESVDPPVGHVGCLPPGPVGRGEPCAVDLDAGVDDCAGGLLCWELNAGDPRCAELCDAFSHDTCSVGQCTDISGVLDEFGYVGVCDQ